jgi:hypothetical protein
VRRLFKVLSGKPIALTCLCLFLACSLLYLINGRVMTSNDNIPHSLLALNWLENHTLHFDNFRNSYFYKGGECLGCRNGTPYFFLEATNGHLTSTYPIGSAIVTFPLYLLFFVYLKIAAGVQTLLSGTSHLLDITAPSFEYYRLLFEKLAGTIATALSVVLLYLSLRLKFNSVASLVSALVYAVATSAWTLNSQGLRQHTVANLVLFAIVLCLFKANRVTGRTKNQLLLAGGFLCGLLPGIRLPCALYAVVAIVYAIFAYRKAAIYLLVGASSVLLQLSWNAYYFGFGNLIGGYTSLMEGNAGSYNFSSAYFIEAFWGLLISPSEGFVAFSPIVIFALPGAYQIYQRRANRDEQLLICLIAAAIGVFINYCFFVPWTGGSGSFGSRYMTDILSVVGYCLSYFLIEQFDRISKHQKLFHRKTFTASITLIAFLLCALLSVGIQIVGVSSRTNWGTVPLPLVVEPSRVWSLSDSQIERHIRSVYFKVNPPIPDQAAYLRNLDGVIEQVVDENQQPVALPIVGRARRQRTFRVVLKNTGRSPWYGYQTGMAKGETRVRVRFLDANNQWVRIPDGNLLFVSGIAKPGDRAAAIGRVTFPPKIGQYKMVLDLVVEQLGEFPNPTQQPAYTLPTRVRSRRDTSVSLDRRELDAA